MAEKPCSRVISVSGWQEQKTLHTFLTMLDTTLPYQISPINYSLLVIAADVGYITSKTRVIVIALIKLPL